jgi:bifunctional enzyme CysN/CysC
MDGASPNVVWQHGSATPAQRTAALGRAGCTIWMTGLSGSGKSTIALAAERALLAAGLPALVLDGDNLRHGLSAGLGFDEAGRAEAVRRAGEAALLVAASGSIAIVSLVSPYEADRARVRRRHDASGIAFAVVHVDAPLAVAEVRDPKGLYKRARAGELERFTGVSDPYEVPEAPDLRLATDAASVESCVASVLALAQRLARPA